MQAKKRTSLFLCALVVLVLVLTLIPSVKALTINGEAGGVGGSATPSTGDYLIMEENIAMGYRITVVDIAGDRVDYSYEVYSKYNWETLCGPNTYTEFFSVRKTKLEYLDIYESFVTETMEFEKVLNGLRLI